MNNSRFIIIGRSSCPYCTKAVDLLSSKQIECIFLDYDKAQHILNDYKDFHKQKTVPIVLENNLITGRTRRVGGYTDLLGHLD